jgi:hypothetical protein
MEKLERLLYGLELSSCTAYSFGGTRNSKEKKKKIEEKHLAHMSMVFFNDKQSEINT